MISLWLAQGLGRGNNVVYVVRQPRRGADVRSWEGRSWTVARRPVGRAVEIADFAQVRMPPRPLEPGEIRVRLLNLAFAPAMKMQMENAASYAAPISLGEIMRGGGVGEIVESANPDFRVGELVCGTLPWSEFAVTVPYGPGFRGLLKLDPAIPPPVGLALLQSGGLTAYFGLIEVARPSPGDTVAVSGAGGAVGSTVGQIAAILGHQTIGIAGGPQKCAWLKGLGFDDVIDYRRGKVADELSHLCPKGVDVFFDNVGGEILEAGIANLTRHGRVVLCGAVSQYGDSRRAGAIRNHMELVFRSATMQGFLVTDFASRFDEGRRRLLEWFRSGELKPQFDIVSGFENAPAALIRMFEGKNYGRQMLRV